MNRQRKVVITVTYNGLGMIVDTKAEELDLSTQPNLQPNLQPTCNNLATDCISRQAAIEALCEMSKRCQCDLGVSRIETHRAIDKIRNLPSAKTEQWIPCSERLPEESLNSVIGWDEHRKRCVFVCYTARGWEIPGRYDSFNITAWMPIPSSYQGE